MPSRRGKRVTIVLATLTVATLAAGTIVFRHVLLEEWYLHRLKSSNEDRWRPAGEWLVEHGKLRAARRLLGSMRNLLSKPGAEAPGTDVNNSLEVLWQTLERIVLKEGKAIVPFLLETLKDKSPQPDGILQMRIGAAHFLGELGPEAHDAIPGLREALKDSDEGFRLYVDKALRKIPGGRQTP